MTNRTQHSFLVSQVLQEPCLIFFEWPVPSTYLFPGPYLSYHFIMTPSLHLKLSRLPHLLVPTTTPVFSRPLYYLWYL